jgi:Bifunctional DNA primase/polymerase, N-terminal/AAA domain
VSQEIVDAARDLGSRVGPVMPLNGKIPIWPDWPNRATREPDTATSDWQGATGIGLLTGKRAGFFVLDVDADKGGMEALAALQQRHGTLPATWTTRTGGGGRHLFFRHPGFLVRGSAGKLGPGLDVRGEGGQVVAPPSRHPSGTLYQWAGGCAPGQIELASATMWLLDRLKPKAPRAATSPRPPDTDVLRRARAYLQKVASAVSGGGGHDQTWSAVLAVVRGFGLDEETAYALLASEYNPRCDPPWSEKELRHKIKSAAQDGSATLGYLRDAAAGRPATRTPGEDDDDPTPVAAAQPEGGGREYVRHRLTRMDTVRRKPVRWLWRGRIPFGKITVLDGDPGHGKSTIALDVAARLTTGRQMPEDNDRPEPADVVIVSVEDDAGDTVRPRLEAAGADLRRAHMLTIQFGKDELLPVLSKHLPQFEEAIRTSGARLLVLDTFAAVLGDGVDMHKDQDVRSVLAPLKVMAEKLDLAVLIIRHFNKSTGGSALHRGGGSIGIAGAARSVLAVGRDPKEVGQRVLVAVKSNLAEVHEVPSLSYRMDVVDLPEDEAGEAVQTTRIAWLGTSPLTADDMVAVAVPQSHEERSAVDEAKAVVLQVLAKGAVPAKELEKEAKAAGVTARTLERARADLRVRATKTRAGWLAALPDTPAVLGGLGGLEEREP